MRSMFRSAVLFAICGGALCSAGAAFAQVPAVVQSAEAGKVMPATVFFKGKTAPVEARNSAGVKVGEAFVLAALVDTSGYSTGVQARYQAYLITEMPLQIEGHRLDAGAYGVGFIGGNTFVVMNIGGHDLFTVHDEHDGSMRRPTPLQVTAGSTASSYRLYAGRDFVTLSLGSDKVGQ